MVSQVNMEYFDIRASSHAVEHFVMNFLSIWYICISCSVYVNFLCLLSSSPQNKNIYCKEHQEKFDENFYYFRVPYQD